jgi:hypothetical protein
LIENNYLEASGENIMISEIGKVPGFRPRDINIRRNYIKKPITWFTGEDHSADIVATGAKKWVVKNLLELKAGIRVTITQNVLEGSWASGQTGFIFVLKPGASPTVNTARTEDIVIENNLGIGGTGAFQITGTDAKAALGSGVLRNVTIRNNAFIEQGQPWGKNGRILLIGGRPANDLNIENNTFRASNIQAAMVLGKAADSGQKNLTVRKNIWASYGTIGVRVDGGNSGTTALDAAYPNAYHFTDNLFVHATSLASRYPTTTRFVNSLQFAKDGYSQNEHDGIGVHAAKLSAAIQGVVQ